MATTRHRFADLEGQLLLAFKILNTAGTPTIVNVSGPALQADDITITDTGTGIYDVVISPFRGNLGYSNVQATPETIGYSASCTARSYTGDALSITIKIMDGATPSAADSSVDVLVLAY